MIEALGVSRSFATKEGRKVDALIDVSLAAEPGEVTGLLGPNGAGKTTLFRILAGLLRCGAGRVRICGHDVVDHPREARAALGMLTEEPGLPERATPLWHVAFHGILRGMAAAEARSAARRLLGDLGVGEGMDRRCGTLSRGNRTKVALARALVSGPRALLLDEPTAGLDIESSIWLRERILQVAGQRCAVLMATHNPHEAERLCSRVILLKTGRILTAGSPAALKAATGAASIEEAYLILQRGRP